MNVQHHAGCFFHRGRSIFISLLITVLIYLTGFSASSQVRNVDSLKQLLAKTGPSVKRIDVILAMAEFGGLPGPQSLEEAVRLCDSLKEMSRLKDALNFLGESFIGTGKIDEAEKCFQRSLSQRTEISYENQRARSIHGLGLVYEARNSLVMARERFEECLKLAEKNRDTSMMATTLLSIGKLLMNQQDDENARKYYQKSIKLSTAIQNMPLLTRGYFSMAFVNYKHGEYDQAIQYHERTLDIYKRVPDSIGIAGTLSTLGIMYDLNQKPEQALKVLQQSFEIYKAKNKPSDAAWTVMNIGHHYMKMKKHLLALASYNQALALIDPTMRWYPYGWIGTCYQRTKQYGKAIEAHKMELMVSGAKEMMQQRAGALTSIYKVYDKIGDRANAYKYVLKYLSVKDSLLETQNTKQLNDLNAKYDNERREQQIKTLEKDNLLKSALLDKNTLIRNIIIAGFGVALLFIAILYNRYRYKKRTTEQLTRTLDELSRTQNQLIQQEKLASLGQLTAGIAHEIKNPLNFVNNFSEISSELVDEFILAKAEIDRQTIAHDLKTNLSRINEHGKRADSIVKSMMMHARGGTGQREPTNINHLLDEAMNLTYHGMRARMSDFNVTIEKNFDASLPMINVVAQDINRMFLNILNNACYAVHEHVSRIDNPTYSPTVTLSTVSLTNKIEIRIRDNGNGIPENIREKIFDPFFTTKPTGEGTGLGLSISYDIITKEHGGEIRIESEEGKGTEFIITLPNK